jgi:HK97 family phage portal protein
MGFVKNAKDYIIKSLGGNLAGHNPSNLFSFFGGFMPLNFNNNLSNQISQGYSQNVDVYSIIKKITDISKSVPWIIEKKQSNGNWKELKDTTLHELMAAPNMAKSYTWDDIEEQILLYLLITGNTYLIGNTQFNSSLIEEVDILPSQSVTIFNQNSSFFMPQYEYQFTFGSSQGLYTNDNLKHIKFFNPNLINFDYGLSPIQVAANVVQVGNERWIADASILSNKGASGFITDKSQLPMTQDEFDLIDSALRDKIGGANNFGKVVATNKDLGYIQLGMSSADMQLLEKGVVTTRTLCNVLGIDSSLLNDPENKTYNNRVEAEKAMYTNCIIPLSDKLSEALTGFLCKNHFPYENVRMRQDFSGVKCLQSNNKEEADRIALLKEKGIISASTAAEMLGMPKLEQPNATLEALSGMSPLLATQVIGQLTEDEIRELVGLGHSDLPKIGAQAASSFTQPAQ